MNFILLNVLNSNLKYLKGNLNEHVTDADKLNISANILTPTGQNIILKPNETLIVTYACNNRGNTANISLGFGADRNNVFALQSVSAGVEMYHSACATFIYNNTTNAEATIYGLVLSNVNTQLMYVMCNYIIIK